MVGIPKNRDYEHEIFEEIRFKSHCRAPDNPTPHYCSVNELALNLRMQPNKVVYYLRLLTEKKLITRHDDKTYPYYTANSDPIENYLEFVQDSLDRHHNATEEHFKKLGKKSIFKNIKRKRDSITFKRQEKSKADYETILHQINSIVGLMGVLPFAQSLGLIPNKSRYDKKIKQMQKDEYEYLTNIISKLTSTRKSESDLITQDIHYRIPIFDQLRLLPVISKPWA